MVSLLLSVYAPQHHQTDDAPVILFCSVPASAVPIACHQSSFDLVNRSSVINAAAAATAATCSFPASSVAIGDHTTPHQIAVIRRIVSLHVYDSGYCVSTCNDAVVNQATSAL